MAERKWWTQYVAWTKGQRPIILRKPIRFSCMTHGPSYGSTSLISWSASSPKQTKLVDQKGEDDWKKFLI